MRMRGPVRWDSSPCAALFADLSQRECASGEPERAILICSRQRNQFQQTGYHLVAADSLGLGLVGQEDAMAQDVGGNRVHIFGETKSRCLSQACARAQRSNAMVPRGLAPNAIQRASCSS